MRRCIIISSCMAIAGVCVSCLSPPTNSETDMQEMTAPQASTLSDDQMTQLNRMVDEKLVMGIRVGEQTIVVTTGLLSQEGLNNLIGRIETIAGTGYKIMVLFR